VGGGGLACHVALDAGVEGSFKSDFYQLLFQIDPDDPDVGEKALSNTMLDSRLVTRMLKFPTGELPPRLGTEISFGGDLKGAPSPAGDLLDELEFFTPSTPAQGFQNHHFVLEHFDETQGVFYVPADELRDPARRKAGLVIDALDPVASLPGDGVVVLIGDELIACSGYTFENRSSGSHSRRFAKFEVAPAGRGWLGTPLQFHSRGEGVRELGYLRVSRLVKDMNERDHLIQLANAEDFDDEGTVAIGRELLGFVRRQDGAQLFMPSRETEAYSGAGAGLFRGSFGTEAQPHSEDSLVYQFPTRFVDRWRENADDPSLAYLPLTVPSRGGFYSELSFEAEGESELARLVVEARIGARGSFADDPKANPDRFTFLGKGTTDAPNRIARQGDGLEIRVFTRYLERAFDARVFDPDPPAEDRGGSNDWKRAPRLQALGVEWIPQSGRLYWEEWR
jgi:hypothetical protein